MRYHYMDTGRAIFMLLGIPFHASLFYAEGWHVTADQLSPAIYGLGRFLSTFRMPAFFLIAGFFAAMILARRDRLTWLQGRFFALCVPFAVGTVLLNPIQLLIAGVPAADIPQQSNLLIAHLWFLASLFWMCFGLVLIWPWVDRIAQGEVFEHKLRQAGPWLVAGLVVYIWLALPQISRLSLGYLNHGVIGFRRIANFVPFYMAGVLYFRSAGFRAWVQSPGIVGKIVAVVAPTAFVACQLTNAANPVSQFFLALASVFTTRAVIALLVTFGDRENATVRDISNKSFSIYVFHQPIIVALAAASLWIDAPAFIEYPAIIVVTFAASYWLAALVEKSPVTRFLFNGIPFWKRQEAGIKGPAAR